MRNRRLARETVDEVMKALNDLDSYFMNLLLKCKGEKMYIEEFNGEVTELGAVIMAVISAICGGACVIAAGVDNFNADNLYAVFYILLSMINGIVSFVLCYPTLKFIATIFITFVIPLIHLIDEKTKLMGIDVLCIPVIAANLFFLFCCITQWRE